MLSMVLQWSYDVNSRVARNVQRMEGKTFGK